MYLLFITKYKSVSEASKFTSINKTGITKLCRGARKGIEFFQWNTSKGNLNIVSYFIYIYQLFSYF